MKYFYFVRDIPVRVVNALYELHQIIEEARKNYVQISNTIKRYKIFESESHGKYFKFQDYLSYDLRMVVVINANPEMGTSMIKDEAIH